MPSPSETLVASPRRARSWVEFDAAWYQRTYSVASDVPDLLADYLAAGQGLGRSPNVFFDEAWYLRRYPDVSEAIRAGHFASGFDHYCRSGQDTRSPHWLFNLDFYQSEWPDLTAAALREGGFANTYDHFLRVGSGEGRLGHPLFDSRFYGTLLTEIVGPSDPDPMCPFAGYLYRLNERGKDIATTIYFDAEWYVAAYPGWAGAGDRFLSPLHHYLCQDAATANDPLAAFSEQFYLDQYPDVAAAVAGRVFQSGYMHFLEYGVFELRNPTRNINLRYYWEHHASVQLAVQSGQMRDAFAHLLAVGVRQGLMLAPHQLAPVIPEEQTRALFAAQAQSLAPIYGRQPIDFSHAGPPVCSVVIALSNSFLLSMQTIASLRQNHVGAIQLILIDSGSVDEVRQIERYVKGAQLLRFDQNIGFSKACNAGLMCAGAEAILFLNSDVRLAPGAIAAALARLTSDPRIGAVGGKVIRSNETLQEAGCIIWRDGWTLGYLRDRSPLCPEACFVRDVDFCSAVFMMARTALLRELDGFDIAFSPAYFEDADLGVRIWQAGYRVVYDPSVVLNHYEYGSSPDPSAARAMMHLRHELFFEKHKATLQFRHASSSAILPFARSADTRHRRILFIEDTIPLRNLGSGYVRANDIIRVMASLDYQVTVFPVQPSAAELAAIASDFPDTVEVMHDRSLNGFRAFLEERQGYYDCIWVSRAHNLDQILPMLEESALTARRTLIVLDTEAVSAPRTALQAALLGEPADDDPLGALRQEFRNTHFCQHVLAVNEADAALLTGLGIQDVRVLGTLRELALTPRSWLERSGLLFVGSLYGTGTPNYDSLCWFVDAVLPLIEAELGYETRLMVAGYVAPDVGLERFANHSRVTLLGAVTALPALYNRHRVVVAPTRFAAGTPYKVYEAASFGVPVVATSLLREQLGWRDGVELLSAGADDAAGFAAKVVAVYRSEALWSGIRDAAAERLRQDNGREAYVRVLRDLLPANDKK
jgi:O-antigen biosynthesis protein